MKRLTDDHKTKELYTLPMASIASSRSPDISREMDSAMSYLQICRKEVLNLNMTRTVTLSDIALHETYVFVLLKHSPQVGEAPCSHDLVEPTRISRQL